MERNQEDQTWRVEREVNVCRIAASTRVSRWAVNRSDRDSGAQQRLGCKCSPPCWFRSNDALSDGCVCTNWRNNGQIRRQLAEWGKC
jgi:hypothetical protein